MPPRFGVSWVFFQGSALPYIGIPLMIAWEPRPTGANRIVVLTLEIRLARNILRADVSEWNLQLIEPDAVPAFILRA